MISLAELLAVLALVSARWKHWTGKVVVYAGDNQNVIRWIAAREAGPAAARFLLQVLGAAEAAGHFRFFAEYIRTYHNVAADDLTRRPPEEVLRENRLGRTGAVEHLRELLNRPSWRLRRGNYFNMGRCPKFWAWLARAVSKSKFFLTRACPRVMHLWNRLEKE